MKIGNSLLFQIVMIAVSFIVGSCTLNIKNKCNSYCHEGPGLTYESASFSFDVVQPKIQIQSFNRTDEAIESCEIQPALPDGLELTSDCSISGKATQARSQASYVITGRTKKYVLQANLLLEITVNGIAPKYDKSTLFFVGSNVDEVLAQRNESEISQCKISPKLPTGLTLSDTCRMSGVALSGFDERVFEVKYVYAGKNQIEKVQIKAINPQNDNVLMMLDARKALGNGPLTDPCQNDVFTMLSDMSGKNSFLKYLIADDKNECATWISPIGNINDPYRLYGYQSTTADLSMQNSIGFNFSQDPYTIISFFKIIDTSSFDIDYGFRSAVPSCLYGGLRIEVYRSFSDPNPDQFRINRILCNNSYQTESFTGSFTTSGWHQMAQVVVPAENKTEIYLDGQYLNSASSIPVNSNIVSSTFSMSLTAGELGNVAIYKGRFQASDLVQHCEYFKTVYTDLICNETSYNLKLNKFDMGGVYQDYCLPVRWNLEDNKGSSVNTFPSGSKQLNNQGQFSFGFTSTIGSFYSDPACTPGSVLSEMKISQPQVQGTIYFKSNYAYKQFANASTLATQSSHTKSSQVRVNNWPTPDDLSFAATDDCTRTYTYFSLMGREPNNSPIQTQTKYDVTVQITDGVQTYQKVIREYSDIGQDMAGGLGLDKTYTISIVSPASLAAAINPILRNGGVVTTPSSYSDCGGD